MTTSSSPSSTPQNLISNDLNTDRLICITNLSTQLSEQDLLSTFQTFGAIQSTRLFTEINAGYVQFQEAEDFKRILAMKQIKIKGKKYTLRSYRQMHEQMCQFSRSNLMNLSGRWSKRFSGLFNAPNSTQPPKTSNFYVELDNDTPSSPQQNPTESQNLTEPLNSIEPLNPFDEDNESESELYDEISTVPSTSRQGSGHQNGHQNGTIPYIDEKLLTINGLANKPFSSYLPQQNPSSSKLPQKSTDPPNNTNKINSSKINSKSSSKQSSQKSQKSTEPSEQMPPKKFKQKTKVNDELWARDLLIDELRVHLNELSTQNETLEAEKTAMNDELGKQVAENFTLIEQNQQLKEENGNFMIMLREKFETHSSQSESPFQDCCVCMNQKSNCALYKCGHVCLCNTCIYLWQSNEENICPVCRQKVEAVIRVYI